MEVVQNNTTERGWNNNSILIEDSSVWGAECIPVLPKMSGMCHIFVSVWEAVLSCLDKSPHVVVLASFFNNTDHVRATTLAASPWMVAASVCSIWLLVFREFMVTDGEGLQEVALGARLDFQGICMILKCRSKLRCFSRNNLVLVISSRVRSLKLLINGLWSVTTSKSSHPW